jgi:recombination protein RecA
MPSATLTKPEESTILEAIAEKRKQRIPKEKSEAAEKLFSPHSKSPTPMIPKSKMTPEKSKALEAALSQISKDYGEGSIMRLGEAKRVNVEMISSGSISLDLALGGGIPKGRVIEIYGPESSGKTTFALHAVSEFQKAGGTAAFVDAEHALDPEYAARIGVDVDNLLISQPDTGEQALEIVETLVRSGAVDVIVIDSVAALTPKAEIEGAMGGSLPGLQARLMSQALRKLTAISHKSGCTLIFINQIRLKIGVMFGNPETTSGGQALKFYASVRLDIRRTGKIETGVGDLKQVIGNTTRVKVVKNKVAPPFRQAEFDIRYNMGIDKVSDLIATGVKLGVIGKSGAFIDIEGVKHQGMEKARNALAEDLKLYEVVNKKVRDAAAGVNLTTGEVK